MNKKILIILAIFHLTFAGASIGITDPIPEQPNGGFPIDSEQIVGDMPTALETGTIYNVKLTDDTKPMLIATNIEMQVYEATVAVKKRGNEITYVSTAVPDRIVVPSKKEPSKNQKINELTIEQKEDSTTIEFTLKDETEHEVKLEKTKEKILLESNGIQAETKEKIEINSKGITIEKNGSRTELKVLPDKAKEKVSGIIDEIETTELVFEETLFYKTKGTKKGKLFYFIPVQMKITTEISAESGEMKKIEKPWWSFLVV